MPEQLLKRHLGPIINSAFGRKSFEPYELVWNEAENRGVPVFSTIEETPTYGFAQPPIDLAKTSERWTYHIVTEKTIYDEFYNCPKCLDGEGGFPSEEKPVKSNQILGVELASINMKLERFRS